MGRRGTKKRQFGRCCYPLNINAIAGATSSMLLAIGGIDLACHGIPPDDCDLIAAVVKLLIEARMEEETRVRRSAD